MTNFVFKVVTTKNWPIHIYISLAHIYILCTGVTISQNQAFKAITCFVKFVHPVFPSCKLHDTSLYIGVSVNIA